jgi:hyperosmotically inducible periplasmic protein
MSIETTGIKAGIKTFAAAALAVCFCAFPALSQAESFKEAVKDSLITARIKAEMAKDKTVSASTIKVETDANGMVQLSGTAKTKAEKDKAASLAKGVKGVNTVDNKIKVEPAK